MSKSLVSLCLLRVLYPICLTASVTCRQDLITGIFLLFLLYIPFVPLPTRHTMNGHTGCFMKLSFVVSVITLILQVVFQLFLLTFDEYGKIIHHNCSQLEVLFRHIGFIRYDSLSLWNCVLHIAPEVIALLASFFLYVICDRLNSEDVEGDSAAEKGFLASIICSPETGPEVRRCVVRKKALLGITVVGKYLCLITLCFACILVPSVTTGFLYVIFLCCMTYWACYKDLGRGFAILCRFVCVVLFFYIVVIFCYQTERFQALLPPESEIPRYFGLQALRLTNCSTDPRVYILNPKLQWPSFVLPFALLFLYYLLIFESGILLFIADEKLLFVEEVNVTGVPSETTPLIRGRESVYRRSGTSGMSQDSHGSITVTNSPEEKLFKPIGETNENEDSLKVDILEYLLDAFVTLICFITRTSYIGTNIIMMTWSITYHSWLTFVLLLGAIILWMVPNQRQSMLRLSPFLIFYAEFLLVTQYIYGMDLKPYELPFKMIKPEDLEPFGFVKSEFPFKDLAIKTLFTTMFWITMRQYMRERQESRSTSTVAHIMAPVHVTVGTATAMGGDPMSKGGQIIQKFGERIRKLLTKFWIWVVTITLFTIGIVGDEMTLIRITYTALALVFIITFQLSWVIWRRMMYGFWLTVIIMSMVILVLIYTFQFDVISKQWDKVVNNKWQRYIGLEKKTPGELFFFLIQPTFFVIITVIQLKYFHKDFLLISDIKSRGTSTIRPKARPSVMSDDEYATQTEEVSSRTDATSTDDLQSPSSSKTLEENENQLQRSRPSFNVFGHAPNAKTLQTFDKIKLFVKECVEVIWLFLELHIKKFILLLVMVVSISDVNVIHFGFIFGTVLALMLNSKFQDIVIRLMSVSAAVALLTEMIFQIDHFTVDQWAVNCSMNATTIQLNGSDWLGLYKAKNESVFPLLSGYIWIILAVTIYVVVITRQRYVRHLRGRPLSRCRVLFPRISYKDANAGVPSCLKYLFNYGFFRFGVEITFISMVILIGTRLNLIALVYAVWLFMLIICSRLTLSKIWYFFNWFVAISIPLQYAICVGLPPEFCFITFQASDMIVQKALEWMFLPVGFMKSNAKQLFWDFIVLLFVTRQTKVFRIEYQHKDNDYPGGSNKSIIHEMESPNYVNPVPDFISHKRTYLDIIKHGTFCSLLWLSCAVAFLAGTSNVTLFSFGYVIGSFLILWQGNDFYLRPICTILKWWNRFLIYNVGIIFLKALFQIPGCILGEYMLKNWNWLDNLLGIQCIKNFSFLDAFVVSGMNSDPLNQKNGGMACDAICFIFFIFQKRLFSSHYFVRIVDEAKAMAVLAARGAELIEELSKKQIQKQQEIEKTVLQKIKNKMDSIKAAQKRIQGIKPKEPTTHAEEPQAPLARETSPSISSAISHQGFHTPLEEDFGITGSRPNSYLQPPTPTSAIMTVSLEGYLEPQRISFGSPPMSHRPFSFDESCQQFSPPMYGSFVSGHRRQSSYGFHPLHWIANLTGPRRSMSMSSHHTSIRSGDYYMFDDEESQNLIEVEDELTAVEETEEECQGKTLGKLMESIMKGDVKEALKSSSETSDSDLKPSTPKSKLTRKLSDSSDDDAEGEDNECSSCQHKSTDATTSKDVTDSGDGSRSGSRGDHLRGSVRKRTSFKREDRIRHEQKRKDEESKDDTSADSECTLVMSDAEKHSIANCWDTFVMYLRFAIAFINSCMVSMIQFLNRKSRDHRYVIQALEKEKKTLKETRNLRIGMRILPDMKWQPIPASLSSQRPKSPLKIEDFESQGLVASSQPVFVRLLLAIYHALMSHSDMVCYFAVFILQIKSPTLASLPLSLMVFFWGTLSIPRPTKTFWVTIIAYTEFVVVIKNIFQSQFSPLSPIADDDPFHWSRILGIEKNSSDSYYDLILLLAVFFHRSTLKSLGLWKSAEEFNKDNKATNLLNLDYVEPHRTSIISGSESEPVTEMTAVNLVVQGQYPNEEMTNQSTDSYQNQPFAPLMKVNNRSISTSRDNVFETLSRSVRDFFNKLMDSNSRIADDVYAYMFFCDFCNIIVIIFGFSSFGASKGDGGVTQYIEDNKIPFAFLAMVIIQFALIVVDRWLYLSRYIVGKLVFQYLLVVVIHIWMFFILPAVTKRRFNDAYPPSIWYLIKCFYLLLSAYQIRSGYPTRILGNFLCKNYNMVNMVLFKIFMLIPFVYELRTLMDWIWTETSMTLSDWIKMEDIFSQIFQLKCMRRAESKYPLPRSQKIPAKTKFTFGAGGLITLFTIIWFPLVLFALGDTVGEPNIPTDLSVKVQISSYQPIYSSYTSKIASLNEEQFSKIKDVYQTAGNAQTFLSDYNPEDVGVITLPRYSSSVWTIPPPEVEDLKLELQNCSLMKISIEWTINRNSENPESPKTVSESNIVDLTQEICDSLLKILITNRPNSNVTVPKLMPKFLKVTSIGKASPVAKLMHNNSDKNKSDHETSNPDPFIDLTFQLEKAEKSADVWWNATESITSNLMFLTKIDDIATNSSKKNSLIIYTFNDKMFPPGLLSIISGKGIIGLYTTFVIVVGAYVKGYFTGTSGHIMFDDMPYVDRILQLCLDIFLVRERGEFDLEEDLFAKLLFLFRSPETMIKWTRPPEDGGSEEY